MDYLDLLNNSYGLIKIYQQDEMSKLEYLSNYIFDFTTHEDEISEFLGARCLEVCKSITDKTTFNYIKTDNNRLWYLTMVNMPFFQGRLEWGTSIRGAWWAMNDQLLESTGLFNINDIQIPELSFTADEWESFINAMCAFVTNKEPL